MPILHVQIGLTRKDSSGKPIALSPQSALVHRGPVIQATFGLSTTLAEVLLNSGKQLPNPIAGWALIDTGASCTCIDDELAQQLGLPVIDVARVSSATSASSQQNVYPVHIELTGTDVEINAQRAIGAPLAAQGIQALIGRDVLQHCVLIQNGPAGQVTLALD